MADRTDTEVAIDILRSYAAGGKDRPGRAAICIAVELIDRLTDPEVVLCGCGDGLSANQDAQCGNCIAADRSGLELRYEAMRSVARRYRDGWRMWGSQWRHLDHPYDTERMEPMSDAERRALDELEADRG